MNWQHLTYFQTAARLENFTKAAEELYITPSALSKAIRTLEGELAFPLFEKRGRNTYLTENGRIFNEYVTRASNEINTGLHVIQERLNIYTGHINLAGIYTFCGDYLPQKMAAFRSQYPNVSFSLEYYITPKILDNLLNGTIDLGFCSDYDEKEAKYSCLDRLLLKREDLIIIVSKNHPLAQRESVSLSELANETFILYHNTNTGMNLIFWDLCQQYNINPDVAFYVPDDQSIFGLVAAGQGISITVESPALPLNRVVPLKLDYIGSIPPYRNQYMVWNTERFMPPVVRSFFNFILDEDNITV